MFPTEVWNLDIDLDMTKPNTIMYQILAHYLNFEGTKKTHVLILGFEGHWSCLTVVWHFDLDLDIVIGF